MGAEVSGKRSENADTHGESRGCRTFRTAGAGMDGGALSGNLRSLWLLLPA